MKKIFLTQGQFTIVDDEDYEWLNQYSWNSYYSISNDSYYAVRAGKLPNGKARNVLMHRQILGLDYGDKRQGDHIHHDTLDNRRSELRIVTHRQNRNNSKRKSTSKYVGVHWCKSHKKWIAQSITDKSNQKIQKHLGCFDIEEDARDAYQNASAELEQEKAQCLSTKD